MRIRESLLWCALSMAKLLALSMAKLLPYQISHRYIIALLGGMGIRGTVEWGWERRCALSR
tara:strand:- start:3810 stop:3992 length:183 start_codon:yes stop_codon:yes gene_type:complete